MDDQFRTVRYLEYPPYEAVSSCRKCGWESEPWPGSNSAQIALWAHDKDEHDYVPPEPEKPLKGKTGAILAAKAKAAKKQRSGQQTLGF